MVLLNFKMKLKGLGIIIDNKLTVKEYINEKLRKANCMLRIINRNFKC